MFDKAVGGGPSVSSLRQTTQIYFLVLAGLAIGGVFLAIAVNEILWYSAVGFETVDTVFTTVSLPLASGGGLPHLHWTHDKCDDAHSGLPPPPQILKISVLVSTAVALFFLYKYYDGQLQELRAAGVGLSEVHPRACGPFVRYLCLCLPVFLPRCGFEGG